MFSLNVGCFSLSSEGRGDRHCLFMSTTVCLAYDVVIVIPVNQHVCLAVESMTLLLFKGLVKTQMGLQQDSNRPSKHAGKNNIKSCD